MKKNNRITIIIAAILVVIAALLVWNNRYLSTLQGESSDFQVWDTASVTKIYLANRMEKESLLERQEHGWTLNGTYKAHPKQVQHLLTTLGFIINSTCSISGQGDHTVHVTCQMPRDNHCGSIIFNLCQVCNLEAI